MLLTRTISKNIEITSRLRAHNPYVSGDPTQIQQVILNIAVNARDAMPQGGELCFETWDYVLDESEQPPSLGLEKGEYFRLRITDTGEGIPEAIQARIFEPFFTTKELGKGTGMGLATAYGIVKNHGGIIRVESEDGRGTDFEIYLPSLEPQQREKAPSVDLSSHPVTTARILMIDDEDFICKIATSMLTRLEYQIETFTDPLAGMEAYQKNPGAYDLVILDVVMPRLDGVTCLRMIRDIDPGQPILMSSGFERDGAVAEALQETDAGFIQKPYKLEALAEAVVDAMRSQSPDRTVTKS